MIHKYIVLKLIKKIVQCLSGLYNLIYVNRPDKVGPIYKL